MNQNSYCHGFRAHKLYLCYSRLNTKHKSLKNQSSNATQIQINPTAPKSMQKNIKQYWKLISLGVKYDEPKFTLAKKYTKFGIFLETILTETITGRVPTKKRQKYPHFVDKRLTPPPLSTSAKVNNIHTKEFVYPHLGPHPPSPLSTFIKNNNIFSSSSI